MTGSHQAEAGGVPTTADDLKKVVDVAEYVLGLHGPMATMKLHKLLYYCQAYCLVTQDRPMFDLDFHAWPCGPVIPELYELHRGKFLIRRGELRDAYLQTHLLDV